MLCIVDALLPSAPSSRCPGWAWRRTIPAASPQGDGSVPLLPCPAPTCSRLGTSIPMSPWPPGSARQPCQSVLGQTWHNATSSSLSVFAPLRSGLGLHPSKGRGAKGGVVLCSNVPLLAVAHLVPGLHRRCQGLVSPHPAPDVGFPGFLSPYAPFPTLLFFFFIYLKKKKKKLFLRRKHLRSQVSLFWLLLFFLLLVLLRLLSSNDFSHANGNRRLVCVAPSLPCMTLIPPRAPSP